MCLLGFSPQSLAARPGGAMLGGGAPYFFPPSLAARIRRSRPFGEALLLRRLVGCVLLLVRAPWGVVPPIYPWCASDQWHRPRSHWASHRRGRSRACEVCWQVPSVVWISSSAGTVPVKWASRRRNRSCASGVCCRAPHAAGLLLRPRLHLRVLHRYRAPWCRSVSIIVWLPPVGSGGGWVFVPSPPPAFVLPPLGSGCCGGSQGFNSLGAPNLSWGRVIP